LNQLAINLCLKHWWHICSNLFISFRFSDPRVDLTEPTAISISKSCQRPKRNSRARHLHVCSPMTLRFESFLPSARSCQRHKSHLRRGGRTWYPDSNWNCTGLDILENKELHNGIRCIPKNSANIAEDNNTCSILFILWLSRLAQAKCCQSEKSKTPSLTSHVMNNQQPGTTHDATVYNFESILLCQIRNLTQYQRLRWTQTATLLPTHTQIRGRKTYKTSRLKPIGNQAVSQTLMANHRNLFKSFRFQTTELILQSQQPSQNPAKDPRGTPEHHTSTVLRRWPWNRQVSSRIVEAFLHINPTCGVEAELGIQTRHFGRLELHNGPHYSPKNFANIAIIINTCSILFINWLSRWAQATCCQREKSKTPSLTSHVMNNHIGRLSTILRHIEIHTQK